MPETLSDRLLFALDIKETSQAELARLIGVKKQVINYICNNKVSKSTLTFEIAEALSINVEWLANGKGNIFEEKDVYNIGQKNIPILTIAQLKSAKKTRGLYIFDENDCQKVLTTTADTGEFGFAIELHDKAMCPRFEIGTILIFNQDKSPEENDFVLSYINDIDDIVFRKINLEDNLIKLTPINDKMYKTIIKNNSDDIIGCLVEARFIYKGDKK